MSTFFLIFLKDFDYFLVFLLSGAVPATFSRLNSEKVCRGFSKFTADICRMSSFRCLVQGYIWALADTFSQIPSAKYPID